MIPAPNLSEGTPMYRLAGLCLALASCLAGPAALAQDAAIAKPGLLVREIVEGMPRGEKQEIRVLTATLRPGDGPCSTPTASR